MRQPRKPLTLAEALDITDEKRIVTTATAPFTIVHTNKAWSQLTGYTFTEVVGKTCAFLQGPGTAGAALELLNEAIRLQRPLTTQVINYTREGFPFRNTIECSPVEGGTHLYATIHGEMLTDGPEKLDVERPALETLPPINFCDRVHGRVQRTKEKTRLKDVLANTTDPLVLCSKEPPHVITHPNQPWLEMCGYTLEEVEGLTNSILTGPETDPAAIKELLSCVRREEPTVQTLVNYKKGGVRFVNQVKVLPVYDENNELAAFMSMLREVDEEVPCM